MKIRRLMGLCWVVVGMLGAVGCGGNEGTVLRPLAYVGDAQNQVMCSNDNSASWSPDGKRIVYSSAPEGVQQLFLVNADGSGKRQITSGSYNSSPSWSPDGKRIAFISTRDGNRELYLMDPDGSNQTRLTNDPGSDGEQAAWSPDSSQIIFESNRSGDDELYLMNADGGGLEQITDTPGQNRTPSWSPDGSKVAFHSTRDGNREIYVMNADGSNPVRLTHDPAYDGYPDWSPDGRRIVYISIRPDEGSDEIYIMNADGSDQTRLTTMLGWDLDPRWSPDGRRIVFDSRRDGRRGLYLMDPDGSNLVKITNTRLSDFIILARQEGLTAAKAALEQARERDPDATYFIDWEAIALAHQWTETDLASAIGLLELTTETFPQSSDAYRQLAKAYRKAGRPSPPESAELLDAFRDSGAEAGLALYRQASEQFPGWPLLSEARINALGYELMGRDRLQEALKVFDLNVQLFLQAWNVYDSMGEALLKAGQEEQAVANYRKSLQLNPDNDNARAVLERMEAAK